VRYQRGVTSIYEVLDHLRSSPLSEADKGVDAAVSGSIHNYWPASDAVLKYLFIAASVEKAAGLAGFATKYDRIRNCNVTSKVRGHSAYFEGIDFAGTGRDRS
jgi:hypothetical protein